MHSAKPTQALIAQELGLSRNTVSKVLNNAPGITEATRKKVFDKAMELNYHHVVPLPAAQAAEGGQLNYDIAFLCHADSFSGSFWAEVIKSMEQYLEKYCCTIRFVVVPPEHERNLTFPQTLLHKLPDGMVIAGRFDSRYYRHAATLRVPMISYDTAPNLVGNGMLCDLVMVENSAATYALTRHMMQKGHRKIAFVGVPESCQSFYERWQGYHRAMMEAVDQGAQELLLTDFSNSTEYYATADVYRQLDGMRPLPDAFVCANDSIAKSTHLLCAPPYSLYEHLDVCGFDNTRSFIASIPQCSTVSIPLGELGQALGEGILWRIKYPHHAFRCLRIATNPLLR